MVAKELTDNALDTNASCKVGLIDDDAGFFVQDNGPGIDPQVADLFSIRRPLKSTKLLRLPSRGALGNGLRVVAGAVLATGGKLRVCTKGQAMNLMPCADGTTTVEVIGTYDGEGTRVEVQLGLDAGPINSIHSIGQKEPRYSQVASFTKARHRPGGILQGTSMNSVLRRRT